MSKSRSFNRWPNRPRACGADSRRPLALRLNDVLRFACVLVFASCTVTASADFQQSIRPLLEKHCIACHGPKEQEGDLRFDGLTGNLTAHPAEAKIWSAILEQLETGAMPPEKRPRPAAGDIAAATAWIKQNVGQAQRLLARKMMRPENGNYVPHDKLFDPKTAEQAPKIAASPARVWRKLPQSYEDQQKWWLRAKGAAKVRGDSVLPAPFGLIPEHELKNYSFLYTLEASQTEGLANNARSLLMRMIDGDPKNDRSLIRKLAVAKTPPSDEDLDKVIVDLYRHWIGRDPEAGELAGKRAFVAKQIKTFGNREGLIYGLVPVMAHPEVFFRAEFGSPASAAPSLLPPQQLADALNRALQDRGNSNHFARYVADGRLDSREDVVAAIVDYEKHRQLSRAETVQRFLDEYFVYPHSLHVFKCPDDVKQQQKDNGRLFRGFDAIKTFGRDKAVGETRKVIDKILQEDQQVLRQLLTVRTDYMGKSDAVLEHEFQYNKRKTEGNIERMEKELAQTGEKKLPDERRAKVTQELEKQRKRLADLIAQRKSPEQVGPDRMGVLTQRSWLVAHSTNTENHAIHRGKWIRERLLGGGIPDLPITVDAALPEDPTKTLRERMRKTRSAECWKCHRLMDPLGLPFEQWDHFGSYRETELDKPVVTTGEITDSGDAKLDGPVSTPQELAQRLASSERVHQVFVRYAFRFWMGRNETLDDAKTIQNAYVAYKESDGSMSALLRSLLTSDAFLYRAGAVPKEDFADED